MVEDISVGDWILGQIEIIQSQISALLIQISTLLSDINQFISTIPQLFKDLIYAPYYFFFVRESGHNAIFADILMLFVLFLIFLLIAFYFSQNILISVALAGIAAIIVYVPQMIAKFQFHLSVFDNITIETILICIAAMGLIGVSAKVLSRDSKPVKRADL